MSLCRRDVTVRREQYQDLLRQAEQERIARLGLSTARTIRYGKALYWLGGRLQSWGHKLVELGMTPTYGERLRYGPG